MCGQEAKKAKLSSPTDRPYRGPPNLGMDMASSVGCVAKRLRRPSQVVLVVSNRPSVPLAAES
ncbi:hypothetical protein ml_515 [Mollivirus sibericum]|uniref:hypothetical protein n=1 Tax=Mollivirus sibericum TaxID=1678078 RepID=UPI0006B2EB57|nr:hypothetical protein ml_9 [Mollivirus sibericum]YP_009165481.1 hypothetical protein ml_515 [Mollivirus sibericum]ALD61811.1 hypothetical protein ml_9 [Mollivirus sibericum]ALD62317.1 hypothetical protein ml_515 [Mollivirus sibericum]